MTDTDRTVAWLREAMDAAERTARKAASLCGCHPPAPAWSFHDGDGPTDGRILVANDPHPDTKRKIGRRWNSSYEGLFMAQHIVANDPAAVLLRIDRDRKTLDACEATLAVEGWEYTDAPELAETVIRTLAEAWGWTEETT